jgi:hypothetical protein
LRILAISFTRILAEEDPFKDPRRRRSFQGSLQKKILSRILAEEDPFKDPRKSGSFEVSKEKFILGCKRGSF